MSIMKNHDPRPSIDGFTLRRQTSDVGGLQRKSLDTYAVPQQFMRSKTERKSALASNERPEILPRPEVVKDTGLRRSEIDESLRAVDDEPAKKQKHRKHTPWFRRKSVIATCVVVLLLTGGGIYFFGKLMAMSGRVFGGGSVLDLLGSGVELKKDTNGRTNVLLFGTSEDDAGHAGAELTDSIMVLSVDRTNKSASMVSMPRDMWVDYGQACVAGYSGKINALYQCYTENGDVAQGANALKDKVGEVFGLDIQYYVKVNYSVVRQLTTALGGVTVTVESSDPRGLYDYNTKLKLPNGPATLQGEQALAFVRARGDGGGYGFEGSNFVREQNQQKMIVAIRDKALNLGTLSNPAAVINIMDALGDNIRTNFTTAEVKTLATVGKEISTDKVAHINLNDGEKRVVTTGSYNGQSIVKPVAGVGIYTGIQSYIKAQMNGGSIETEDATITVLNGSGKVGAAAAQQTELTQAGLLNITTGDTTYTPKSSLVWYDLTGGEKPKTQAKLTSIFGVKPTGTSLPSGVQSTADFVVILGSK